MAIAASIRTSLRSSSASRLATSSIASSPKAVAAMNAIRCDTSSCSPIGLPHWTRWLANSRAIFVAHLLTPAQIAGNARRPVFSVARASLSPMPSRPITFSAGT